MFRKNKLRKKALAICVASVLWTVPSISTANGLKSEMDALFNEMSNVTQPGVFETQRRGFWLVVDTPRKHAYLMKT